LGVSLIAMPTGRRRDMSLGLSVSAQIILSIT